MTHVARDQHDSTRDDAQDDTDDPRDHLALALDVGDLDRALAVADLVQPWFGVAKVGFELYAEAGPDAFQALQDKGFRVFADLKLHDIPNTVAGAAAAVAPLDPAYLTVHAAGGTDMVRAAVEAAPRTRVAAVTVLTSLDATTLASLGFVDQPLDVVRRLAALAVGAGARALVCSPREVAAVRAEVGPDVVLITPGVRPVGSSPGDQARVATPEAALDAGADLLVVGRPLTGADDPGAAAAALADAVEAHLALG
jgi:orotidine-5'-phosphate decarboxylase